MSQGGSITTHILDLQSGRPAADVEVVLDRYDDVGAWIRVAATRTNADGRATDLLAGNSLEAATYRLTFETRPYLEQNNRPLFFPRAAIEFNVDDPAEHYHVPLLLSPYGYSTYRGS